MNLIFTEILSLLFQLVLSWMQNCRMDGRYYQRQQPTMRNKLYYVLDISLTVEKRFYVDVIFGGSMTVRNNDM